MQIPGLPEAMMIVAAAQRGDLKNRRYPALEEMARREREKAEEVARTSTMTRQQRRFAERQQAKREKKGDA